MADLILVFTTVEKREDAERIAGALVDRRLAACVQILPGSSVFRWKGRTEKTEEFLLVIKTREGLFRAVEREIENIHPYELPEIVAIPAVSVSERYLAWVRSETENI